MSLGSQQYAELADHCYDEEGKLPQLARSQEVFRIEGVPYKVLRHVDNSETGYQGTVYQQVDSAAIVVAHRGTEPDREPFQDIVKADAGMVATRSNLQAGDAIQLTRWAMEYAKREGRETGASLPAVSVTGHSLGGTLAQITAHHFGLRGETFNAYGAVSLDHRLAEGGTTVINHVVATDVVSSGSPHYGQVRVYAAPRHIEVLRDAAGYTNSRGPFDVRNPLVMVADALDTHGMHNFLDVDGANRPDVSLLHDPRARALAAEFDPMIDRFRSDVAVIRGGVTLGTRSGAGLVGDAVNAMRRDLAPGEPARLESGQRERMERGARGVVDGPTHREWRGAPLPGFLMPGAGAAVEPVASPAAGRASPADADHPQHALLQQIRAQARARESDGAIRFNDAGERERFCRYALAACQDNRDELRGFYPQRDFSGPAAGPGLERADHLVIGTRTHAFLMQGDIESPATRRIAFTMEQARQTPVEESDAKVQASNRSLGGQVAMQRQQDPVIDMEAPPRGGRAH